MNEQLRMDGKTCLVTGAGGGIGKETALALAHMGATVLIEVRDRSRGELVIADARRRIPGAAVELFVADLSSQRQVQDLAEAVREAHPRLDVLINNAGAVNPERRLTEDGLEMTLATNHVAPFLLTQLLRDALSAAAPARVITVSSYLHNMVKVIPWDDLQGEAAYRSHAAYNLTKLMNVLFTRQLAREGAKSGITANCLHPGWPLKTDLGRQQAGGSRLFDRATRLFASSAKAGARTSVYLAASPDVASVSGEYFAKCRVAKSSTLSHDRFAAERLWETTHKLCSAAMKGMERVSPPLVVDG